MSEKRVTYRSASRGSFGGILATILLHGGLIFMIYWSQRVRAAPEPAVRELMVTQLVKMGKPREKFWLPKINRPQRTAPKQQIKISDDPNAAPAPKEAPRPEDTKVSDRLRKALERARFLQDDASEPDDEGQLDGSEFGTASEASQGNKWATEVNRLISSRWNTPLGIISDAELAALNTQVVIKMLGDGTIVDANVKKSSGNREFDTSVIEAVKAVSKLPKPPASIGTRVALDFNGKQLK